MTPDLGKRLAARSLDDLAAFLLADKAALKTAIDKLSNGEPLLAQEAELLEAAVEHLEPPDDDEDDMQMASASKPGTSRAKKGDLPPARLPFPVTRAMSVPVETQTTSGAEMPTMIGHFSTFNDWYEVDSAFEGHFLERISPSAFDKTIRKSLEDRGAMKVLYDHGQDPQIGNKVLGSIEELRTDKIGPAFVVPLFDTSYNRDLAPGLTAGAYGTSFRFTVNADDWNHTPTRSEWNADALPERTITEARVYEFGPVTFPANPNATVGVRSTTDTYYRRSRDPEQFETLLRSAQVARTSAEAAATTLEPPPPDTPELEPPSTDTPSESPPPVAASAQDAPRGASSSSTEKHMATEEYGTPEARESRITELREMIARQAIAFPGELPAEEQSRYDADNDELDQLERDKAAWESRQARVAQLQGSERHEDVPRDERGGRFADRHQINRVPERDIYDLDGIERGANTPERRSQLFRDNAMRITEVATFPHPDTDIQATRDKMAWLLDHHDSPDKELARRFMATASPLYQRAFNKLVLRQQLTPEEQRGTALAVGVDGTGGFAIPVVFDLSVIAIGAHTGAINPYRRVCRVVPIVGTDTWNALTATAVTATRTTEAAPAIEQGPTFAQPQYIVKRVQAQITYSMEVAQDRTDIASEMAVLIGEAKDNEEELSFATGAGTGSASIGVAPVNGTSGAYTSLTTAASVTLAAADADLVEAALPVRHRFNAQWFLSRSAIRKLQTLEILGGKVFGGNGYYPAVGNPGLDNTGNTGLRILGYPVNESPSIPTTVSANVVIGTLLNPQSYVIVDRIGMSVQIIPFIFGASQGNLVTGQQALYAMWRNTAAPLNVDGGRTLRYLT